MARKISRVVCEFLPAAPQLHFTCYSFVFLKLILTVFGVKLCKHVLFTYYAMLMFHCLIDIIFLHCSGAQGEYTGLRAIRAYHEHNGAENRKV